MRPNQQNNNKNRQRGRSNNNGGRKHVNPLSRNYESNGPDVKVRGNAAHVAEKYLQLARDAQSSGDPVLAENYLQHAEHYFRIVASAQPQGQRQDQFGQPVEEEDFDDDFTPMNDRFASPERPQPVYQQPPQQQQMPQPAPQSANGEAPQFQPRAERSEEEGDEPQGAEPAFNGEGGGDGQQAMGQGPDGEPRRHRDRRPRRRRGNGTNPNGGAEGSDPGNAPQPEVGDLPAFITAGGNSPAE